MIKIFAYGTLYDKDIQLSEFGTHFYVEDDMDYIRGYDIIDVKMCGEYYKVAIESGATLVAGSIIHIPDSYLELIDQYEGKEYERISVKTLSGVDCQMYVKRVDK
jgi:gamma-glutamylcyclotransferase (GGCT)/AIG2-like uncharacterized protein YtfP